MQHKVVRMRMRMKMKTLVRGLSLLFVLSFVCSVQQIDSVNDAITINQIITDGQTITSTGGSFEMGFFSPNNSKNRYVGMWYKKISVQTVVWVANREVPLINTFGYLKVIKPGLLVVCDGRNNTIWSSNSSRSVENPIAKLLDNGNLVVKDAADGDQVDNFLWQSFDHPTHTLLPGMKLGWNFETGFEVYLSSWKSSDDPAAGEYSSHFVASGYPQKMLKKGSVIVYRNGPWNGVGFSGRQILSNNSLYTYRDVFNKQELYFTYDLISNNIARFTLIPSGVVQRLTWDNQAGSWKLLLATPAERCDFYGICGAYGSCDTASSTCSCLEKFSPKFPEKWASLDGSGGCIRNIQLDCYRGDGFRKYVSYKVPDTRTSWFDRNMSLDECRTVCLKNCTCTAYSSLDIRNGGSGCLQWFENLVDMQVNSEKGGQDIYIRMASSESDLSVSGSHGKKREILAISLALSLGMVALCIILILWTRARKKKHHKKEAIWRTHNGEYRNEHHKKDLELPFFDLSKIIKATNDFSDDNKLGEGGFGVVYKGYLEGGLEVAVKRLRETSTQGLIEFKNEVICIAKLQHRNLVKLLGCCIEGMEKILVFEYMPNKSLDFFIFDKTRSKLLDWSKRLHIIQGIARGMLYLHQDSRLRIIHRDLKASNILLDADMNPKISDFGTARSFGGNEIGAKTRIVVGTHGYMSPEYAVDGLFSVKSDIFSFGVVVLEIISGQRNTRFSHHDHHHNLLGHAWKLFKEGRALEIVDPHLDNSCSTPEVIRAIQVGLLCVQRCPEDRPSMSSALFMLENEGILPEVKQPGFFVERSVGNVNDCSDKQPSVSIAEITITLLEAR